MEELQTQSDPVTREAMPGTSPGISRGGPAGEVALRKVVVLPILEGGGLDFQAPKLWLGRFATGAPIQSAISWLDPLVRRQGGSIRPYEGAAHYWFDYLVSHDRSLLARDAKRPPDKSVSTVYARLADRAATYKASERLALEVPANTFLSLLPHHDKSALFFRGKIQTGDAGVIQTVDPEMPATNKRYRLPKASVYLGTIEGMEYSGSGDLRGFMQARLRTEVEVERISLELGPLVLGYGPVEPHVDTLRELQDIDACRRPHTA